MKVFPSSAFMDEKSLFATGPPPAGGVGAGWGGFVGNGVVGAGLGGNVGNGVVGADWGGSVGADWGGLVGNGVMGADWGGSVKAGCGAGVTFACGLGVRGLVGFGAGCGGIAGIELCNIRVQKATSSVISSASFFPCCFFVTRCCFWLP